MTTLGHDHHEDADDHGPTWLLGRWEGDVDRTTTGPRVPRWSPEVVLAVAGLLLPLLVVLEPPQPVRAVAAGCLLLLLPGLALVRAFPLPDPVVGVVVAIASSIALTVLVSTGLMYAGAWTWQAPVLVQGVATMLLAGWSGRRRST